MDLEPIPLRTLTVLLNYERVISNTRFTGVRLMNSSFADPQMVTHMHNNFPQAFATVPGTIQRTNFHTFEPYKEPKNADITRATYLVHPKANANVNALKPEQLESIYYETRSHDECYKAAGLYQFFFELCPADQKISIQMTDEEPVLVAASSRGILELKIGGPRLNSIITVISSSSQRTFNTGMKTDEPHAVLVFFHPQHPAGFVVDMTRTQYGDAGRGMHGENYFLGTIAEFRTSMREICVTLHEQPVLLGSLDARGNENEARLRACAAKVLERWQNRETEGWCAFCGKPGVNFQRCPGCTTKEVLYCCVEHRKSDWKLHKWTCEKNQK